MTHLYTPTLVAGKFATEFEGLYRCFGQDFPLDVKNQL